MEEDRTESAKAGDPAREGLRGAGPPRQSFVNGCEGTPWAKLADSHSFALNLIVVTARPLHAHPCGTSTHKCHLLPRLGAISKGRSDQNPPLLEELPVPQNQRIKHTLYVPAYTLDIVSGHRLSQALSQKQNHNPAAEQHMYVRPVTDPCSLHG